MRLVIRHHHERWNGSGYPDGLAGDGIPLTAQILGLVDVYDALVTERSYKRAFSSEEALQMLQQEAAAELWNPDLFAEFLPLVREQGIKV